MKIFVNSPLDAFYIVYPPNLISVLCKAYITAPQWLLYTNIISTNRPYTQVLRELENSEIFQEIDDEYHLHVILEQQSSVV